VTLLDPGAGISIDPDAPVDRLDLGNGSWVDVSRGWLKGHDQLFASLKEGVAWRTNQLFRYDHWVDERRLGSFWQRGNPLPDPALAPVHKALEKRYGVTFGGFGLIQYRDGRDGQAFHGDTDMRWLDDTLIAILTLGAKRPWYLRPRRSKHDQSPGRGATHDLCPAGGDLIVMGGRCQADWEHSVPYLMRETVGTRISLQWRHARKTGRPFQGAGYSAPLNYSR
jgi:alkylated DNA repair dioxygenase AlkB